MKKKKKKNQQVLLKSIFLSLFLCLQLDCPFINLSMIAAAGPHCLHTGNVASVLTIASFVTQSIMMNLPANKGNTKKARNIHRSNI